MDKKSIKITGLKSAVGAYNRANAGGEYSPVYGCLMLDLATGKLWTDEFCSIGHNSWKSYDSDSIVNLLTFATRNGIALDRICMETVKSAAEQLCSLYARSEVLL